MKTNLTLLVGLLALGFCLPNAIAAEGDDAKDKPKRKGPPSKEQILKRWDKDKDGALSKEEIAAMPERMSARLLEKWDKDGDKALSKEEVDAIKFKARGEGGKGKGKGKGDGAKKKDKDKDKDGGGE